MPKISPCLWFDSQAEDAARFYVSLFPHSKVGRIARFGDAGAAVSGQKKGSVMTVEFSLDGQEILGLNGGPIYQFSPGLSFFVWCETEAEIDGLWEKLAEGGKARMPLSQYPWARKYGWTADKNGLEWQLMLGDRPRGIAPAFLFVDKLFGKGQEALDFYMSVFKESRVEFMARDEKTGTIMHSVFTLAGRTFALMEGQGTHGFTFTPAFSFVVNCQDQAEIDHYWAKLSAGGKEENCGWLQDKFGVSWQVVPANLCELMTDPRTAEKTMQAIVGMRKLDIAKMTGR